MHNIANCDWDIIKLYTIRFICLDIEENIHINDNFEMCICQHTYMYMYADKCTCTRKHEQTNIKHKNLSLGTNILGCYH